VPSEQFRQWIRDNFLAKTPREQATRDYERAERKRALIAQGMQWNREEAKRLFSHGCLSNDEIDEYRRLGLLPRRTLTSKEVQFKEQRIPRFILIEKFAKPPPTKPRKTTEL